MPLAVRHLVSVLSLMGVGRSRMGRLERRDVGERDVGEHLGDQRTRDLKMELKEKDERDERLGDEKDENSCSYI